MPLGTAAILGLATAGSAAVGAVSAGKAADAQQEAAQDANDTQRYIFDQQVDLTEPQREIGNNALAALAYQYGVGPQPTFGGSAPYEIREINETSTTASGGPFYQNGPDGGELVPYSPSGTQNTSRFAVGDQVFDTRDGAQSYLDGLDPVGGSQFQRIAQPDPNIDLSQNAFEASPGYQFRLDEGNKALERTAAARGMRFSGASLKDAMDYAQGTASNEYGAFVGRETDQFNREYGVAQDSLNALRSLSGVGQTATQAQIAAGTNYANAYGQNALAGGNAAAQGAIGVGNAITSGVNSGSNILGLANSGYLGQNPGFGITPVANPFGG